jgi:hypothetical protein
MPTLRILLMLSSLTASGCAGITPEDRPLQAAPPPPEGKRLAELANEAFAKTKLTGAPEVSAVRPAHDNQWGDWVFCIKSNSADQSLKYAVLIGHDAILEVRSSVLIDGCNQETYSPLPPAAPPAKAGGHK